MLNLELTTDPGIYRIVRLPDGPIYVGSSVNMRTRAMRHRNLLGNGIHPNLRLQRSWNKTGGQHAFAFEQVVRCHRSELIAREQWWVDYYRVHGTKLYNSRPVVDSQLGFRHSAAAKAAMSVAKLAMTDETRCRMSEANRTFYREHPESYAGRNAGHRWTDEQKQKLQTRRPAMLGRKHSEEVRAAMRTRYAGKALFAGRKHSDETKAKMRAAKIGKPLSPEHAAKLSASIKAAWARRKASC